MKKYLVLLVLYGCIVAIPSAWFLLSSADLMTFLFGVIFGGGIIGAAVSGLKLFRPEKYLLDHEKNMNTQHSE